MFSHGNYMDYQEYERPSWDEYFMAITLLTASRASCQHVKSGAIIVKDKRIIATGYNGAPSGIKNCLELGCRKKRKGIAFGEKNSGACIGEHAERNALLQISQKEANGATMYSVLLPCSDCAKQIVGAGIKKVFYNISYKEPNNLVHEILEEKGIELKKLDCNLSKIFNLMSKIKDLNEKKLK